ncbi:MAG: hypothetical protein NC428_12640, partial [Clostridium sp.]|nr:hypothetical protein [Clostridium sp.]
GWLPSRKLVALKRDNIQFCLEGVQIGHTGRVQIQCRRVQTETRSVLLQPIPEKQQGLPTTPSVPKALYFYGFPDILFLPFVSIKRFSFLCKRSL